MTYAPFVAKNWIYLTSNSSLANAVIKYVCGVGIASRNQSLVFVLHAARPTEMILMNSVL